MTGNYHGSIHALINLSSLYQSLVQLLEHDRAISCPLNSNLLNILLLGGSGPGKRGGAGGAVGWAMGLLWKVLDPKDGLDSGLRPNFFWPGSPTPPVGDPYL